MKDATLFVVGKSHQGDNVVENLIHYMTGSIFAEPDEMLSNLDNIEEIDTIIDDIYQMQEAVNMANHRVMFHMVISTRPSKVSQNIIDEGAYAILDYFNMLGHQVLLVPHYGSTNSCHNYHFHIAVNPISFDGKRLLDKYATYNEIISYLNTHTRNSWSWRYTTPASYKKYIQ